MAPTCPQENHQMDTDFWNQFTNKYLFQKGDGHEEVESSCSPSPDATQKTGKKETKTKKHKGYIAIDLDEPPQQKQDQTGLRNFPADVEDLYIEPVIPYVEPYEAEMRKKTHYEGSFDCYYENKSHILSSSDEEQRPLQNIVK